jgi:hypothetical protein
MNQNLKLALKIVGALVALYVVLIILKKVLNNPDWLNWVKSPFTTEQEFFRFEQMSCDTDSNLPSYNGIPMRPSLIPPIPPRFEGYQLASNLTNQVGAPMNMLASPPSSSPLDIMTFDNVDFSNLGGSAAPISAGSLTTQQASEMLKEKFANGTPEMQDVKDLMPVPDMRYTTGLDPTDPQNFMYDRTIFGRLKRRYGNEVDHFRGDIDVKPQYRGWFDLQPPTETDVVRGYFDNYIDIEQQTAVQDAIFDRVTPVEDLYKASVNPGGKDYLTRYAHY